MGWNLKILIFSTAVFCLIFLYARIGVLANPAPPVVSDVMATDPVDLNACSTVVIWCNATISDATDWKNIDTVNATFWDPAATTIDASDDNSTHYTNSTCRLEANYSLTDVPANCSFTVQYYANPADWTCKMYANNTAGESGSNSKTDVTINTLRALDANDTINFGALSPGANSTADVNNTIVNCGNVVIDLNLNGTNLTNASATLANISVSSVKYNVTNPGQDYTANMTSLSATPTYANFTLAKRTNGGLSLNNTHWKIGIPASIENLIFTGNITFTAVADT